MSRYKVVMLVETRSTYGSVLVSETMLADYIEALVENSPEGSPGSPFSYSVADVLCPISVTVTRLPEKEDNGQVPNG